METTQTAPESNLTPAGPETEPAPLWTGPKKRRKWIKRVLVIAAVLVLLFWIVVRPMLSGGAPAVGAYQTAQVQRQDLTVSVSGSGTVTPIESYQVSALVTGEILESPFEDGDQVEQDQLLYRIDPGSAQTALGQQPPGEGHRRRGGPDPPRPGGGPGLRRDGRCRHHRHLHHDPHGALPGR